jgi:hypothetical protein
MQRPSIEGPLTTPKAFRRMTGAHTVIVSILFADFTGLLIATLIGALIGSPTWWLFRAIADLFHASLTFDIGFILCLFCFTIGQFRQRKLKKDIESSWGCAGPLIFGLIFAMVLLFLVKTEWMTIPARIIPTFPLETFQENLTFASFGIAITISLYLLAHVIILYRSRQDSESMVRSFSRAHPDGQVWLLIEQAYTLYKRSLTRFDPPPIAHLKTPATFYYYQRQTNPDDIPNPEREMYWIGENLIINQAYIGSRPEQVELLLPFLARLLYDNNSPDHRVKQLFRIAREGEARAFCAWILALPLLIAKKCEKRWEVMERDHVLDRDRFAYYCGQGKRLRRGLQYQLEYRVQHDIPDNSIPTLVERIDHLDSLIGREASQVKKLREALPLKPSAPPTP